MKIIEVIDKLNQWHEPYIPGRESRDKIIIGDANQECTGICITISATYEVLKKAKELNANLIISHEYIFYGSRTEQSVLDEDEVYLEKKAFIEDNHIVVYRDHDRIHGNGAPFHERTNPDYIFYGICKELGWDDYVMGDKLKPLWYKIPKTTGKELADLLIEKFSLNGLRVVGDLDSEVSVVWFCEHINGNERDSQKIKNALKADAMIPFEIVDYTLTQYVNDAFEMNKGKVILEMGHFNCEELGMKYMETWLKEYIHDIPITFIQSKDLFQYYIK